MIRCVRIWTGEDSDSLFEEGTIDLPKGERGDVLSDMIMSSSISFRETVGRRLRAAMTRQPASSSSPCLAHFEFKTAKDDLHDPSRRHFTGGYDRHRAQLAARR